MWYARVCITVKLFYSFTTPLSQEQSSLRLLYLVLTEDAQVTKPVDRRWKLTKVT